MAKNDPRTDRYTRRWNRELVIVAALVGAFILIGAIYTAINGPQPTEGAGGTINVEAEVAPSGALRPANAER